jgi:septum formation inhibitor-activating ATPase MinD
MIVTVTSYKGGVGKTTTAIHRCLREKLSPSGNRGIAAIRNEVAMYPALV